jgi:hypothetical protein
MGYGHLRAAATIARAFGVEVTRADRPPVADEREQRLWRRTRVAYEAISRTTRMPLGGRAIQWALEAVTAIDHLHPYRDQSRPTMQVRALDRMLDAGMGEGVARHVARADRPLVATHFIPALAADRAGGAEVWCVVTDTDLARAWVAVDPARSRIRYLAPTPRARRRLLSHGVPPERIHFTGFPLPLELVGGPSFDVLRERLAARLVRLDASGAWLRRRSREIEAVLCTLPNSDGAAPLVTFAIGGAGAQVGMASDIVSGVRRQVLAGRLRLALVAGTRSDVAERLRECIDRAGLDACLGESVELLHAPDFAEYDLRFVELLARTDVLWTKPSELTFYGALGIPLVLSWPVGVHEAYNRRWACERGAGLRMGNPRHAGEWLLEWLDEGVLASAALAGFLNLPSGGTLRIRDVVGLGP